MNHHKLIVALRADVLDALQAPDVFMNLFGTGEVKTANVSLVEGATRTWQIDLYGHDGSTARYELHLRSVTR